MDSITIAQRDMRVSYYNGMPGVVSSGSVWLIAGIVAMLNKPMSGILTLVFGGMLIFPIAVVLCKVLGATGKHSKGNPLAPLAIEGTLWMLLSIPIAIGAAFYKLEWFFPAMMLVIAGRYLTFSTMYGLRIYWFFSTALVIGSVVLLMFNAPAYSGAFVGAGIEYSFAVAIFILCKKEKIEQ